MVAAPGGDAAPLCRDFPVGPALRGRIGCGVDVYCVWDEQDLILSYRSIDYWD